MASLVSARASTPIYSLILLSAVFWILIGTKMKPKTYPHLSCSGGWHVHYADIIHIVAWRRMWHTNPTATLTSTCRSPCQFFFWGQTEQLFSELHILMCESCTVIFGLHTLLSESCAVLRIVDPRSEISPEFFWVVLQSMSKVITNTRSFYTCINLCYSL